jgi:hypothetical protein
LFAVLSEHYVKVQRILHSCGRHSLWNNLLGVIILQVITQVCLFFLIILVRSHTMRCPLKKILSVYQENCVQQSTRG